MFMVYANSNNGIDGCVGISWNCGDCISDSEEVMCGGYYMRKCGIIQHQVSCQVCIKNSNYTRAEEVNLNAVAYNNL